MQLTSIIALLSAAAFTGVQAAPSSSIEERQAMIGYIRFYGGTGCQEPWVEDTVFQQGNTCSSQNVFSGAYGSFNIQTNSFTRTSKSEFR